MKCYAIYTLSIQTYLYISFFSGYLEAIRPNILGVEIHIFVDNYNSSKMLSKTVRLLLQRNILNAIIYSNWVFNCTTFWFILHLMLIEKHSMVNQLDISTEICNRFMGNFPNVMPKKWWLTKYCVSKSFRNNIVLHMKTYGNE